MANRSGLVVGAVETLSNGYSERAAILPMVATEPGRAPKTVGTDNAHDLADFVEWCRQRGVSPCSGQRECAAEQCDRGSTGVRPARR